MILKNKKVDEIVKTNSKKQFKFKKIVNAFLVGGSIGLIAHGFYMIYNLLFSLEKEVSLTLTTLTLILVGIILTALCVFDNIAKIAGAGSFIPTIGFANSMSSSALEGRSEGLIFGIGSKIFSLVGSVFAYGIFTSYICGIIYYLIKVII